MKLICYSKCGICRKAKKWLEERQIPFQERDIKEENPTEEELREWIRASGIPAKKFFNTSGLKYKELKLKDRMPEMTEEEQIALLASDGMLVKRPVLLTDEKDGRPGRVLVGFQEAQWEELL